MNYKSITYYLSYFCFPVSFLSFVNILYSLYFDYFLTTNLCSCFNIISSNWYFIFFIGRNSYKKLNFEKLIILTYLLTSIFFLYHTILVIANHAYDSFFESISGLTLTGFSVLEI